MENQYFVEGINFFHVVVAKEDTEYRIVQINRASLEMIETSVKPELSPKSKIYEAEVDGIEVIECAENGLLIDGDGCKTEYNGQQ